jgi:hypothetical protein
MKLPSIEGRLWWKGDEESINWVGRDTSAWLQMSGKPAGSRSTWAVCVSMTADLFVLQHACPYSFVQLISFSVVDQNTNVHRPGHWVKIADQFGPLPQIQLIEPLNQLDSCGGTPALTLHFILFDSIGDFILIIPSISYFLCDSSMILPYRIWCQLIRVCSTVTNIQYQ